MSWCCHITFHATSLFAQQNLRTCSKSTSSFVCAPAYRCTDVLHSSDKSDSLRGAGADRLRPSVSEHASHGRLVRQTEHALILHAWGFNEVIKTQKACLMKTSDQPWTVPAAEPAEWRRPGLFCTSLSSLFQTRWTKGHGSPRRQLSFWLKGMTLQWHLGTKLGINRTKLR